MLSSRPSPSEITAQHQTNVATMSRIKSKVLPLKAAATNLAETARQLKDYATQLEQNGQRQITSPNGERVAAKDLIRSLNRAKDAIKSLESELTSLGREVDFFQPIKSNFFKAKRALFQWASGLGGARCKSATLNRVPIAWPNRSSPPQKMQLKPSRT